MKRISIWFCTVLLLMFSVKLQAADVDEIRGALLFHLSKVITFPQADSAAVNLCVYPQSQGIIQFFKAKGALQSQGKPFQLRVLDEGQQPNVDTCQMLYLQWPLKEVSKTLLSDWSSRIITISHDPAFLLSDGLISLTLSENKMVIMMNKDSLKKSTVTFPSRVLKLAAWYP